MSRHTRTSPRSTLKHFSSSFHFPVHRLVWWSRYDDILLEDSRFAQGGFAEFRLDGTDRAHSEGRGSIIGDCDTRGLGGSFWGWGGAGGSAFIWSPEHECGFACEF